MRLRTPVILAVALAMLASASGAAAEVVQLNGVRVRFGGEFSPRELPRLGAAPVAVSLFTRITPLGDGPPPQLRRISIALSPNARIDPTGLPVCRVDDIQPSTSAKALQACRGSLVGRGQFYARVLLPEQAPFPSAGKILAFSGTYRGKPAILAHVYGTTPAPTATTIPFVLGRARGGLGQSLTARLPEVTTEWGYVTGLDLTLSRSYRWRGERRSYVAASCPAPRGAGSAVFPFASARFGFDRFALDGPISRGCRVRA
jgi:hypothetical protein